MHIRVLITRARYFILDEYLRVPFRYLYLAVYVYYKVLRNYSFLPVSYQLPLVSASWLRCACGSE